MTVMNRKIQKALEELDKAIAEEATEEWTMGKNEDLRKQVEELEARIKVISQDAMNLLAKHDELEKRLKSRPLAVTAEVMKVVAEEINLAKTFKSVTPIEACDGICENIRTRLEALPNPEPTEKAEPPNAPQQEAIFTYDSRMGQEKAEPPADLMALVDEVGTVAMQGVPGIPPGHPIYENIENLREAITRQVKAIEAPENIMALVDEAWGTSFATPMTFYKNEFKESLTRLIRERGVKIIKAPSNIKALIDEVFDMRLKEVMGCSIPENPAPNLIVHEMEKTRCDMIAAVRKHGVAAPASDARELLVEWEGGLEGGKYSTDSVLRTAIDLFLKEHPVPEAKPIGCSVDEYEMLDGEVKRLSYEAEQHQTILDEMKNEHNEELSMKLQQIQKLESHPPRCFSIEQVEQAVEKVKADCPEAHSDTNAWEYLAEQVAAKLKALEVQEPPLVYGASKKWMLNAVGHANQTTNRNYPLTGAVSDTDIGAWHHGSVRQGADYMRRILINAINAADIPEPPAEKPNKCPTRCCFTCEYCEIKEDDDNDIRIWCRFKSDEASIGLGMTSLYRGCPDWEPIAVALEEAP